MLVNMATIGIGVVAGYLTLPLMCKILPASVLAERQSMTGFGKQIGILNVALGALLFTFMRNKRVKEIGLIIAGMGVYDLIAVNVAELHLPPLPISNPLIDSMIPGAVGAPVTPKSGYMGASYRGPAPAIGTRVAGSYGPSSYGGSYSPAALRAFGDDLDLN